jgi:hypothetical protein
MREKVKAEISIGAGELKSLRNEWWEIKKVIRMEEFQLDCKPIEEFVPHTWGPSTSQTHSQYLISVAEVKKKYIIRGFFVPTLISNETFCLH